MEIFCFLLGILYLYTHHIALLFSAGALFFITPRYSLIVLFLLGIAIAWLHQEMVAPQGMPDVHVIPNALIKGSIVSLPIVTHDKSEFHFALEEINHQPAHGIVKLSWYNKAPGLRSGQRWELSVKLKKPRNFLNPGSYDYVTSLMKRHISWTGYIRPGTNQLLPAPTSPFTWLKLRERLGNSLEQLVPDTQTLGVIEALTLNTTTHISQENWDLFRRTGTIHLFGISGEHIALISGLIFIAVQWFWSRSAMCCLLIPAHSIAGVCGFLIAVLYAFLAGFEPPVQRALIGCFFYTLSCLGKQRFSSWQVWRYALFGVLFIEPHAVFMQGFYFSFLAVACLLLTQQRWRLKGYKANLALQLSCLIGLMPLTLYWFSYGSLNGFIANLFAIPLVGFLIVPLALLTMLCSTCSFSWLLINPLSWLISLLFQGLSWTEQLAAINITWPIHSISYVISLLGALLIIVLLPIRPFKYLALLWFITPFFPARTLVDYGDALIQVLDVGQGLAVAIQTQHHTLLYDTGDQWFGGNDLGKMVILPFYAATGIKKIDKIVISHPDKDHRGGLKSIAAELPVGQLLVNEPEFYHQGLNCHYIPDWEWDGVNFHFFPVKITFNDKNNNSCILKISTAMGSVLLAGDIEKKGEDYLVKTYGEQMASDILIVPHHGSSTSSSYRFLLEVSPAYAIASLGFDNRFHFPHVKTISNMKALNIPFIRTDECGMTQIKLSSREPVKTPVCFSGKRT